MATVFNSIADFLARQSWQLLVVFALVFAGSWGLRKASAHWRYLLWLVVIAKCLTPPMLSLPLAVLPHSAEAQPSVSVANVPTAPRVATASPSIANAKSDTPPTLDHEPSVVSLPNAKAPSSVASSHFDLGQWLTMAWMSVVGITFIYISGKAWTIHRGLRRARLPADEKICQVVETLAKELGICRVPTIYMADSITQPFVWGWLRGNIYCPVHFGKTLSVEQQRAILAHELAHVARWDAVVNHIQIIVQAIFFFHPLIWWTNKKIRQEREKCCDEIVLSDFRTRPRLYCEAIVDMLTLEYRAGCPSPGLAVTGSTKHIEERIATILTPDRKFCRRPSWTAVVTLLLVAACVLPTAFVLTTRAAAPTTKATPKSSWQKGQVMDVRVINAQTKEAIPGVKIELQNMGPGINFQDIKVYTTDAEGRSQIALTDLPPTAVRLYPTKDGFVPLRVYWEGEPTPEMPKLVTIPMEPGKAFGGTIRNDAGEPISNVAVTVHYWAPGSGKNPHLRTNIDAKTISDNDGKWQVNVMPAKIEKKELRIFVNHPEYVSDHLSRIITPIPVTEQPPLDKLFDHSAEMVMHKGDTIEGRITDKDGKPVGNALIHDGEYYWFKQPRATTDGDGKFRIAGVKPIRLAPETFNARGDFRATFLTVEAAGYAPDLVKVTQPNTPLKVQLEPGQSVRGRIVDEDGKPVGGVSIYARTWRAMNNRLHVDVKSDADGRFQLSDVPADEVKYDFSKDGYMLVDNFPMSPSADEYLIRMKAPLRIVGSVGDADTGRPLEKFTLIEGVGDDDGRPPDWKLFGTRTISNGKYEFVVRQEGFPYFVRVEAEGYMPGESEAFRAYNPDKGTITYDFKLRKAAPLTGSVVGLDGKPLADATVYLATGQMTISDRKVTWDRNTPHVKTDREGRFKFPPEVEPFCLVAVHEQGVAMITEETFKGSVPISIEPWTNENQTLQIIRRPAVGQGADFPKKSP